MRLFLLQFAAFVLCTILAGCTCQLSGTPLDTMEKMLNPACWFTGGGDDGATPPTSPTPD